MFGKQDASFSAERSDGAFYMLVDPHLFTQYRAGRLNELRPAAVAGRQCVFDYAIERGGRIVMSA